jgi:phosphate butyryltransferase
MAFQNLNQLVDTARAEGPVRIAVAAGHDPDVIAALKSAMDIGLAEAILVGDRRKICALSRTEGLRLRDDQIIDEPNDAIAAREAVGCVRDGRADLLMKGSISTATLIKAVLDKESGLRGDRLLSQVIVFEVPGFNRLMLMSDAALSIAPGLAEKIDICRNAIAVAHVLGIREPNLAALCALELVNPDMPATIDAAGLAAMNRRGQITGAFIEGPIALDVPLSRFAAERKGIQSRIVENTDIFVAPNIEAANILYRAILYFAKGESAGIVVGAGVPLVLLSRAESSDTKIRSIALGLLVARAQREAVTPS